LGRLVEEVEDAADLIFDAEGGVAEGGKEGY